MGDIYDNLTDTQLIEAVRDGQVTRVKELIDSGADVNEPGERGWTPLSWAAGKGNLEVVILLVENGADVFKVGRDQRTPNMIAVAAAHADVARFLRQAEDSVEGKKPALPSRNYCKAYRLKDLQQFADWEDKRTNGNNGHGPDEDEIVFVHENYNVSQSIWSNEHVIFDNVTPEWQDFCDSVLGFRVPDDLDLVVAA